MTYAMMAPAKINLTLEVLARREDGYHSLRSLMVPLAFGDDLQIEPSAEPSFACSDPDLGGEDNLAARAIRALPLPLPRRVSLIKRVPTGAGLGGGSSDAAAILRAAMNGAFGPMPSTDWVRIARDLGSDVPFFLVETGALIEGTGERVTAVGALPAWHVLIVKPPVATSTASAYADLDRYVRPSRPRSTSVSLRALDALQRCDFEAVEACLSNDFQSPSRAIPEVARALDALASAGAGNATLTGSGSAVFTLAPDRNDVLAIDARLDLPAEYRRVVTRFETAHVWRAAQT